MFTNPDSKEISNWPGENPRKKWMFKGGERGYKRDSLTKAMSGQKWYHRLNIQHRCKNGQQRF